ncbi:MAG: C4-type zinc ribbon domain-containing protein [Planctomycetota bacterium]
MGATLDALHRLQEVELQIAEIRDGINRKARAVTRHQAKITEIDAKITAQQAAIRHDQMEADRLDLDVKTQEAGIAKLRGALNLAKTNKEYSAVLTQLNTNKADNGKVEERVLTILTQIDTKKQELAGLREERAAEETRVVDGQAAVKAVEDASRDRLTRLLSERDSAATAVPKAALDVFNRICQKMGGEALAHVIRTNPKRAEFACSGCNMAINIEQVNAIMSRDDAITCKNCGRIMYLDEPAISSSR